MPQANDNQSKYNYGYTMKNYQKANIIIIVIIIIINNNNNNNNNNNKGINNRTRK